MTKRAGMYSKRFLPTPAQAKVLRAMAAGERLEHWPDALQPISLRGNGSSTPVQFRTWKAIYTAGWAQRQEATEGKAAVRHYVISPLGRDALQQLAASAA